MSNPTNDPLGYGNVCFVAENRVAVFPAFSMSFIRAHVTPTLGPLVMELP
jgi:hypothetical protein